MGAEIKDNRRVLKNGGGEKGRQIDRDIAGHIDLGAEIKDHKCTKSSRTQTLVLTSGLGEYISGCKCKKLQRENPRRSSVLKNRIDIATVLMTA